MLTNHDTVDSTYYQLVLSWCLQDIVVMCQSIEKVFVAKLANMPTEVILCCAEHWIFQ